jgi:hypothetical protein
VLIRVPGTFILGRGTLILLRGTFDPGGGTLDLPRGTFVLGYGAFDLLRGTLILLRGMLDRPCGTFILGCGTLVLVWGTFDLPSGTLILFRGAFRDPRAASNLHGRFLGVRLAPCRLVLGGPRRIFHGRLLQGRLVGIVDRLLPLRFIDRLAGIAVTARIVGVPGGGGGFGFSQRWFLLARVPARIGPENHKAPFLHLQSPHGPTRQLPMDPSARLARDARGSHCLRGLDGDA